MITPAYAPTATERVLPRLALDFTTGVLDARVTVTRALNTATRVNSSGLIATVNADLPRFDYNPVTLASKGLLIEEARTNLQRYSEQFDNAVWLKTAATISADSAISPDGTTNADKLVESATTAWHSASSTFTYTAATYTFSVYAKAAERNWVYFDTFWGAIYYNLSTGVVGTVAGGGVTASIQAFGNGWYRCTATYTATAITRTIYISPSVTGADAGNYAGDGTSGIYIWGAQLEVGAFPTSYIPTTTTSLTRNADVVSMTGTNFSDWFNATEGTLQIIGSVGSAAGTCSFGEISDGTSVNAYWFGANNIVGGAPRTFVARVASANQAQLSAKTVVANTVYNSVNAYKVNSFAAAADGNAAVTDTSGTIPTVDRMIIGGAFLGYANGPIQKINYWSQRLTNAEVQAFSK